MKKYRVKDFIMDSIDGRIYAVAVTLCDSNKRIQKQLEIEYSGFIPGFYDFRKNDENQIITGIQDLSLFIHRNSGLSLYPTVETKQEFVRKNA